MSFINELWQWSDFTLPYERNTTIPVNFKTTPLEINWSFDVTFDDPPEIVNVIFNDPATVVLWDDGSKTVVKCGSRDTFDEEKGLAMAICKKLYGNTGRYNEIFKRWCE